MSKTEALERLVGSRILQVKLLGSEDDSWGVEITTTDGETIMIRATMYEDLSISVKRMEE